MHSKIAVGAALRDCKRIIFKVAPHLYNTWFNYLTLLVLAVCPVEVALLEVEVLEALAVEP